MSRMSPALAVRFFATSTPWKPKDRDVELSNQHLNISCQREGPPSVADALDLDLCALDSHRREGGKLGRGEGKGFTLDLLEPLLQANLS